MFFVAPALFHAYGISLFLRGREAGALEKHKMHHRLYTSLQFPNRSFSLKEWRQTPINFSSE